MGIEVLTKDDLIPLLNMLKKQGNDIIEIRNRIREKNKVFENKDIILYKKDILAQLKRGPSWWAANMKKLPVHRGDSGEWWCFQSELNDYIKNKY